MPIAETKFWLTPINAFQPLLNGAQHLLVRVPYLEHCASECQYHLVRYLDL